MSKFLVLNPNPKELDDVLAKSNLQNLKNGPFEAVVLLGDVLESLNAVPSTDIDTNTYFGKGKVFDHPPEEASIEIKPKLTYFGRNISILKLKSGYTLGYIAASATPENLESKKEELAKVDILVTYDWPAAIAKQNKLTLIGDVFLDQIAKLAKPRYHFAVGNEKGRFFESPAYQWKTGEYTRFISLGQKGSGDKWFYAFGISDTAAVPANIGTNPFEVEELVAANETKRQREDDTVDAEQNPRKKTISASQCFFCLSNPQCETHMIVSIGSHSYLTIAKGPLPNKRHGPLGFSGHGIIIPIEHIPSNRLVATEEEPSVYDSPLYQEYLRFQDTLSQSFSSLGYSTVFFEINKSANVHHHTQVVPVPNNYIQGFESSLQEKVTNNNEKFLKNQKLSFQKIQPSSTNIKDIVNGKSDFILFTVCEESNKTYFYAELKEGSVDLQFPRRVLASLLRCAKRVYWEKCRQTMVEEKEESQAFKAFYEKNDFTRQ